MALEELNKEIYDESSKELQRTHEESQFNPESSSGDISSLSGEKKWGKRPSFFEENRERIKKGIKIGSAIVGFIAVVGIIFIIIAKTGFDDEKVSIKISGMEGIGSNQDTTYKISYKNENRVGINKAELILNYSESFIPQGSDRLKIISPNNSRIAIGEIRAHSEGEVEISGKFFAPQDETVYINAVLDYTPSSFSSSFKAEDKIGVLINSSPLFLEVMAPLEANPGNAVEYLIEYKNLGEQRFDNVRVKVDYPEGFNYSSSEPSFSEGNNLWYLGSLEPSSQGKIRISGTLNGNPEEIKKVSASLLTVSGSGEAVVYNRKEKSTKISASDLIISQSINGLQKAAIYAGERLDYEIYYKNTGQTSLRNAVVTVEIFGGNILDFSKIDISKGSYNSSEKRITWKASDISALSVLNPGEEGKIKFSVPVLERIPVENENDKNFSVKTVAKIESSDLKVPVGSGKSIISNTLELKLNSKVILEALGYYNDKDISNSGPIPPQVGKETSYALHLSITNISNDISNVEVTSSLPSGVKWSGKIFPESEKITFDDKGNRLVWEVGKVESGAGIIKSKREVAFQVSIVPEENQINKKVILLNNSVLTAKDNFTGENIKVEIDSKDNVIREDKSVEDYLVVPAE